MVKSFRAGRGGQTEVVRRALVVGRETGVAGAIGLTLLIGRLRAIGKVPSSAPLDGSFRDN